ncbi:MAG TPA: DsbA family protein [Solirubrobacterales bacterium]|jgi:2-hydroxychromene-2-carboxylate isomerase|nr:DsbA family protein [Solirubrobacterales bacterium]
MSRATFYFDLGSPYAYLSAERVSGLFIAARLEQPEWQPILLGGLFRHFDRNSWGNGPEREAGMAEVERRGVAYGLPPIVWPDPWPGNTLAAMRVATFAKQTGRAVSFSLAAFRQSFAAGRDLTDVDNVMIAGAACELHPRALLKAIETKSVKEALREATDGAAAQGVEGVPALVVGDEVFWGDDRLEDGVEAAGG